MSLMKTKMMISLMTTIAVSFSQLHLYFLSIPTSLHSFILLFSHYQMILSSLTLTSSLISFCSSSITHFMMMMKMIERMTSCCCLSYWHVAFWVSTLSFIFVMEFSCRDFFLFLFTFVFLFILMPTFVLMLIVIVLPFSTIIITSASSPQQQFFLSLSQPLPFSLSSQLISIYSFSLTHISASCHYCY